jgi:DeoR/GlpR family transcriptional regulator of sugar metabolism
MDQRERHSGTSTFNNCERHYSVQELATTWNVSACTIRRMFREEDDVVVISNPKPGVRTHEMLRIPESVAERVKKNPRRSNLNIISRRRKA